MLDMYRAIKAEIAAEDEAGSLIPTGNSGDD